jgi:hypothetical protein
MPDWPATVGNDLCGPGGVLSKVLTGLVVEVGPRCDLTKSGTALFTIAPNVQSRVTTWDVDFAAGNQPGRADPDVGQFNAIGLL